MFLPQSKFFVASAPDEALTTELARPSVRIGGQVTVSIAWAAKPDKSFLDGPV